MTKITIGQEATPFSPVEICITMESQDEVNALFCIFNHTKLIDFLEKNCLDAMSIHEALGKYNTGSSEMWDEIKRLIP